jgi:hypothetical protein
LAAASGLRVDGGQDIVSLKNAQQSVKQVYKGVGHIFNYGGNGTACGFGQKQQTETPRDTVSLRVRQRKKKKKAKTGRFR